MKVEQVLIDDGKRAIIRVKVPYVSENGVRHRVNRIGDGVGINVYQKGNNIVADIPQSLCQLPEFGNLIISLAVLERTS